jgi:hypothetical protein
MDRHHVEDQYHATRGRASLRLGIVPATQESDAIGSTWRAIWSSAAPPSGCAAVYEGWEVVMQFLAADAWLRRKPVASTTVEAGRRYLESRRDYPVVE